MQMQHTTRRFAVLLGSLLFSQTQVAPAASDIEAQSVRIDLDGPRPKTVLLLSATGTRFLLDGPANGRVQWGLSAAGSSVRSGQLALNAAGQGSLSWHVPDLRQDTTFKLLIKWNKSVFRQPIVGISRRQLADQIGRGVHGQIGVIDPSGQLQKALSSLEVKFIDLRSQLQQDFFEGKLVLVGSIPEAKYWALLCSRFQDRIQAGMHLVAIDPPDGWTWPVRRNKTATQKKPSSRQGPQKATLPPASGDAGQGWVRAQDLGKGQLTIADGPMLSRDILPVGGMVQLVRLIAGIRHRNAVEGVKP